MLCAEKETRVSAIEGHERADDHDIFYVREEIWDDRLRMTSDVQTSYPSAPEQHTQEMDD